MEEDLCDTNRCLWVKYIRWYDENPGILESDGALSEALRAYYTTFTYWSAVWPDSFNELDDSIGQGPRSERERKLQAFYEESSAHVTKLHQESETSSPATGPLDDESSYEVVGPSSSACGQNAQSIRTEASRGTSAVVNNIGIPQHASEAGAQSGMDTRGANLEQALLESKNQMELVQQKVASDIEQARLEFKNEMEVMQKTWADGNKGMAGDTTADLAILRKTSDAGNKVTDTAQSAMATRIAHLEHTLMERNERDASLEQSLQNKPINSHEERKVENTQPSATAAEESTVIEV
ncbi:hypothetical protein DFS34DRAFT_597135 [Phlyctochytrium arcticum]|nr:hypothetical protein DFS34DRAFT_597135 [Phlyctochytrium arcticum]